MRDTYRPRRVLVVLAALLLPAATCGVAPALQELMGRVNLLESRAERLERFAANAQLPPVLIDEHYTVVGTVLEYNDMFLYASINDPPYQLLAEYGPPYSLPDDFALATVQLRLPGRGPAVLEAHRYALLAPTRGQSETFWFETPDCTGAPLVYPEWISGEFGPTAFNRVYIGPPGETLYVLPPDVPPRSASVRSYFSQRGVVREKDECKQWNHVRQLRPFEPVVDLDVYMPPYRIVDQRELWGF